MHQYLEKVCYSPLFQTDIVFDQIGIFQSLKVNCIKHFKTLKQKWDELVTLSLFISLR